LAPMAISSTPQPMQYKRIMLKSTVYFPFYIL
jgi:hypothetical protein